MIKVFTKNIGIGLTLLLLASCGGSMEGLVRGDGSRVVLEYKQGFDRDYYITTIDGEYFSGQAIAADSSSSTFTSYELGTIYTSTSSGKYIAVMFGDRGSTLRCDMNYASSSGYTSSGGVGICYHSDGRVVDIIW